MRIHEITESELVAPQHRTHDYTDSELTSREVARQNIPSGVESWVDDWHDPHEVGLKNFDPTRHDAKTIYYTQMADLMGANPYMPVVYNIDQFGETGNARMEFRLERLVPANQVDLGQLVSCLKTVLEELGNPDPELMSDLEIYQDDMHDNEYSSDAYDADYFDWGFRASNFGLAYSVVTRLVSAEINKPKNSTGHLREFSDRIRQLLDDAHREGINIRMDLHQGNFMFRRVRHGVQLVINDPMIIRGKK